MSKKILLIGGAGFLGTYLYKTLSDGAFPQVSIASRAPKKNKSSISVQTDILDYKSVGKTLRPFDLVVNLTGQITSPIADCLDQNTQGISNIVRACEKFNIKYVQISSVLVYGSTEVASEKSQLNPESPYAMSKAFAEFLIQDNLPSRQYLIIRMSNLYGEKQPKGLFWFLTDAVKKHKTIEIKDNDGTLRRNFIHCEDAAQCITKLIQKNASGIYNLAGPNYYSIREIIKLMEKITKKKLKTKFSTLAPQSNLGVINTDKLVKKISPQFKHSVEQFLQRKLVAMK